MKLPNQPPTQPPSGRTRPPWGVSLGDPNISLVVNLITLISSLTPVELRLYCSVENSIDPQS